MSAIPGTQAPQSASKHLKQAVEELTRITESDLPPEEYSIELLRLVQTTLMPAAGAVWGVLGSNPQLQVQYNIDRVAPDNDRRVQHFELVKRAVDSGKPLLVTPQDEQSGTPLDILLLVAPIMVDQQVIGLLEACLETHRVAAARGALQFLNFLAGKAALYFRQRRFRQQTEKEELWTALEAFCQQIHASLDPYEVSFMVANDGRRLIDCDRLSVAIRQGRKTEVAAVSGADVVEHRSNLIKRMRQLLDAYLNWNVSQPLVYSGTRDETLPPPVLEALDEYLAESESKLLIAYPLRDRRETVVEKPCRSVLLLESFEPLRTPKEMVERIDVVGKHMNSALYNALEHRRIPLRWVWQPLATLQEGVGGKTRAIVFGILAAILILTLAFIFVPYPLKMEATGELLPEQRALIFSPSEGHVVRFDVKPGDHVRKGQNLVLMHDVDLEIKLVNLNKEIEAAERELLAASARLEAARGNKPEQINIGIEIRKQQAARDLKLEERDRLRARNHAEDSRPGHFWIKAPQDGVVLSTDYQEKLTGKYVSPADPLLRIGEVRGDWLIQLKVPQKHIGQVLQAYQQTGAKELDVDLLLLSAPTRTFRGKLARDNIAGEANPQRDKPEEAEPVVDVYVRISGRDIPPQYQLPRDLLLTGTEVHAKIRCGDHAMGYSLFYGVWEFLYEKVIFVF
ncbi:MAG: efflux RND transporter periplasmic adaptor subunit [Gemmataceae bacterium]